jgi:hypothetical protein
MAMNYNTLVLDLQTYMLRTDTPYVDKIPDIIDQGVIRIYNNAKDIGFEFFYRPADLNINQSVVVKPGDWRETTSFSIIDANNNKIFLQERTFEYCKTYLPNQNITGVPKYYCDTPVLANIPTSDAYSNWTVFPAADGVYTVNIIYLRLPPFNSNIPNGQLVAPFQTNFLTARYPNLLLYSCLLEASLFLDNEEKRNKYEMMFSKELETINNMNVERTTDRTVTREKS